MVRGSEKSLIEIAVQSFAAGRIFQCPVRAIGFPMPAFGQRFTGHRAGQLKPDHAIGRRTVAGVSAILRRRFDLPAVRGDLSDDERERRFGELHERATVRVGREQNLADDFRCVRLSAPNGLALKRFPARRGEIGGRQKRGCAAAGRKNQNRKQEQQRTMNTEIRTPNWRVRRRIQPAPWSAGGACWTGYPRSAREKIFEHCF